MITKYFYDDDGKITHTTTTSPSRWTEGDRAAVDELQSIKADSHMCGQHLSETIFREGGETSADWVGVYDTCVACNAIQRDQRKKHEKEKGEDPLTAGRMWRAMRLSDAIELAKQQQNKGDARDQQGDQHNADPQ